MVEQQLGKCSLLLKSNNWGWGAADSRSKLRDHRSVSIGPPPDHAKPKLWLWYIKQCCYKCWRKIVGEGNLRHIRHCHKLICRIRRILMEQGQSHLILIELAKNNIITSSNRTASGLHMSVFRKAIPFARLNRSINQLSCHRASLRNTS